jgi:hypothetical protein
MACTELARPRGFEPLTFAFGGKGWKLHDRVVLMLPIIPRPSDFSTKLLVIWRTGSTRRQYSIRGATSDARRRRHHHGAAPFHPVRRVPLRRDRVRQGYSSAPIVKTRRAFARRQVRKVRREAPIWNGWTNSTGLRTPMAFRTPDLRANPFDIDVVGQNGKRRRRIGRTCERPFISPRSAT